MPSNPTTNFDTSDTASVANADQRRSREEQVLLALSGIGAVGVAPFAVYRALESQPMAAAADGGIVAILIAVFLYVWRTGRVRVPSLIVTLCFMSVVVAVNYISGPSLLYWAYPTMAATFFLVRPNEALVINGVALAALLPIVVDALTLLEMTGVLITLALNTSFAYVYARFSLNYQEALARMASEDPLTGVGNRASFAKHMRQAMAESKRMGTGYFLLLFDVDHFKQINDNFGHAEGDRVLKSIAVLCEERTRDVDCIYRLGGEEFAIVAMGIDFEGSLHLANKIRQLIAEADMLPSREVTVSVGVAALNEFDTVETITSRADKAMYRAKHEGRNRVFSERDLGTDTDTE